MGNIVDFPQERWSSWSQDQKTRGVIRESTLNPVKWKCGKLFSRTPHILYTYIFIDIEWGGRHSIYREGEYLKFTNHLISQIFNKILQIFNFFATSILKFS